MARSTPHVEDGILYLSLPSGVRTIAVGSSEWCLWLVNETVSSFHFTYQQGSFTARRERKNHGSYWYAYRKLAGRLKKVYLGKTEELLLPRLREVALLLSLKTELASNDTQVSLDLNPNLDLDFNANLAIQSSTTPVHNSILTTKLYLPPTRPTLVQRARLLQTLDMAAHTKLTLLSAPAGFGKTTLLSAWLAGAPYPYAWLSLDKNDNDPVRFWLYVSTALQRIIPAMHTEALPSSTISLDSFLTALLNTLSDAPQPLLLLLDDYHVITNQAIHDSLDFFLDHLPAQVHLLLASRTDPPLSLMRLRANGQLCELRTQDLRFSAEEVSTFLHEVMHLDLTPAEITMLNARTEGWIAGLQLAALSLQGQPRTDEFIATFAGTHRYIFDYLSSEVIQRQPEHIRDFLYATSVLERLNASLCNALTKQEDGQAMLEHLEKINLFLIPLDAQRQWYRYHHLFADFLLERLQQSRPTLVPELHRRASLWYESQQLLPEAITHSLQTPDQQRSLQLIEDFALDMMKYGEVTAFLHWLQAFPEETIRSRPRLRLFQAGAFIAIGQLDQAELYLQEIEQMLSLLRDRSADVQQQASFQQLDAEYAASRSVLAAFRSDLSGTITWSQYALTHLHEEQDFIRSIVASSLGTAYFLGGDLQAAYDTYTLATAASLKAQNLHAGLASIGALGFIQAAHGHLQQAIATHKQAIRLSIGKTGRIFPVISMSYANLCEIWYERNELAEAQRVALEGIELGKRWGYSGALAQCSCILAIIQLHQQENEAALATMHQLEHLVEGNAIDLVSGLIQAYQALIHLRLGNYEQAFHWVQSCEVKADEPVRYPRERAYLIFTQILLAQKQLLTARRFLERLVSSTEDDSRITPLIDALIQFALLEQAEENTSAALQFLNRAIQLASSEGFVRVFLDKGRPVLTLLHLLASSSHAPGYTLTLLQAAGEPLPPMPEHDAGPLSERELHILRYLADGKSNQLIAKELVIALSTVKTHLSNIYYKMGVHSRTQAIARARELHLLI